jgi:hypothetical protein
MKAQIRQFFHERNLPAALLAQVKARRRAITTDTLRQRRLIPNANQTWLAGNFSIEFDDFSNIFPLETSI